VARPNNHAVPSNTGVTGCFARPAASVHVTTPMIRNIANRPCQCKYFHNRRAEPARTLIETATMPLQDIGPPPFQTTDTPLCLHISLDLSMGKMVYLGKHWWEYRLFAVTSLSYILDWKAALSVYWLPKSVLCQCRPGGRKHSLRQQRKGCSTTSHKDGNVRHSSRLPLLQPGLLPYKGPMG